MLVHIEPARHVNRSTRVANALKCAIAQTNRLPALQAGHVKLSIERMKSRPHNPGFEFQRKLHDSTLRPLSGSFHHQQKKRGLAVGCVEQFAFERAPALAIHPAFATAGVIDAHRQPANRLLVIGRRTGLEVDDCLLHELWQHRTKVFSYAGGAYAM